MEKYYKFIGIVDGKPKWVVIDGDYDITKDPTKDQLDIAIEGKPPKRCCICRKEETYVDPNGKERWRVHRCDKENCTGFICHLCDGRIYNGIIDDRGNPIIRKRIKVNHTNTVCCMCKKKCTNKNFNGDPNWIKYRINKEGNYDRYGNWDNKSYLCTRCYSNIRNREKDSYREAIKSVADSRTGNLDRSSSTGEAIISQWICAIVLGLRDMNIEKNNFNEHIDLSLHSKYGMIDVKNGKWIRNRGYWQVDDIEKDCNTIIIVCGDGHKPWINIKRVYIIPKGDAKHSIVIVQDSSRRSKWKKFRVDEGSYNDAYHSVDIPKYFSPFNLWKGKYNKKIC